MPIAAKSGVKYIVQAGGAIRDDVVIEAYNENNLIMALSAVRLFHHSSLKFFPCLCVFYIDMEFI